MLGRVQIHNLLHTEPTKEKIVSLFRGTASQTLVDVDVAICAWSYQ